MLLKLGPGVDPRYILGYELHQIIGVTKVHQIFYCVRSKNDIILNKNNSKKISMGIDMIFPKLISCFFIRLKSK
jgi:hypothetical protein